MIVLDASVVVKWFQEESDSEQALYFEKLHVNGEETIAVPDLLFYEVASVFCHKKGVTNEAADAALDTLAQMEIRTFTFSPLEMKEVFRFARTYAISVYDAIYAVLAQKLGCSFVTADRMLYNKLKKFSWVKLL